MVQMRGRSLGLLGWLLSILMGMGRSGPAARGPGTQDRMLAARGKSTLRCGEEKPVGRSLAA